MSRTAPHTESTDDAVDRRLDDSAMACINAHVPYWWVHVHFDGVDDAEYYVVRRADPWDSTSTVLGSERCASYDEMVERVVALNKALVDGADRGQG